MLGKVKNCIDGQQLSEMPTKADSEAPEGSTAVFSWLVDRGVDLSRCLFFNKTSSLEKVSQIHAALAAVLPGVDFVLLFTGDPSSPYLCIKASSAAAAEDPAVAALASHRPPECLYSSLILYLPPTPRNECFHFDHRAAAVAAVEYKQQLRTPPTAAAVVKQQQQRQKRIEQLRSARFQRRGGESGDDDRRNAADERIDDAGGCGCIDIGVPSLHDVSDLKQINERVAQAEQIRGRHIQPCRLFSSLPACAQLINQFACGRWKFTLPLPKPQTQTDVDAVDLFRSGSSVPTMFEVMRPMSPFGVTWYFVGPQESVSGNSGAAAGKSGKAVKVQGILSYRSPMGVLSVCPEAVKTSAGRSRVFKQPGEIYAVAVAQQNKESISQAWAEGATLLPQREAALLMLAFLPGSSQVELTVKASVDAPVAITSVEMLEGMRLSQAAHSPILTLSDLLRINILRHLLSKALQGDPQTAAAAAALQQCHRSGSRKHPVDALLEGDGHGELQAALQQVITCCNEPVTPAQVLDHLVRGGAAPDQRIQLLFYRGLPLFRENSRQRSGGKKGSDSSLTCTVPAFEQPHQNEPACLPPYNIISIAQHYDRLLQVRRLDPGVATACAAR
ncbi:hypothetical protein cyc_03677 [Cyclospora cayetanensis]|uniref:Uncharacterized protein n=1 Tax=Cyclospora cayetanensis TaxID=88456 RepID=A0A1D3CUZ3_9EIME|nr:hypothetical protein cyc_03677 [Cyclospora cayetanensis]